MPNRKNNKNDRDINNKGSQQSPSHSGSQSYGNQDNDRRTGARSGFGSEQDNQSGMNQGNRDRNRSTDLDE